MSEQDRELERANDTHTHKTRDRGGRGKYGWSSSNEGSFPVIIFRWGNRPNNILQIPLAARAERMHNIFRLKCSSSSSDEYDAAGRLRWWRVVIQGTNIRRAGRERHAIRILMLCLLIFLVIHYEACLDTIQQGDME